MKDKILVLGIGNTLLKDDGIAVRAVEEISYYFCDGKLVFKTSPLSGLSLMEEIVGYGRVIIFDAIKTGAYPVGELIPIIKQDIENEPTGKSPHFTGLASLIQYSRNLGLDTPEEILIFGIEVDDPYTFDEEFGDMLKEAYPSIVTKIYNCILKNCFVNYSSSLNNNAI